MTTNITKYKTDDIVMKLPNVVLNEKFMQNRKRH